MEGAEHSQNPKPPPPDAAAEAAGKGQRDVLLHLEAYLARRDGVDKLLKISRYAAKIALASSLAPDALNPRLRAFESSVGLSRKAFRLGKFVQDVNALRAATRSPSPSDRLLSAVAYGGEGLYYFIEQLVWLSKAGLISPAHSRPLQRVSAWAELVGYVGSIALKARELRKIRSGLESLAQITKSTVGNEEEEEIRRLREKLLLKQLSIFQDLADGLMVLSDVSDGKVLSAPLLLASSGMVSALISTHKNWSSC